MDLVDVGFRSTVFADLEFTELGRLVEKIGNRAVF
jgi:hypothetical protein